MDQGQTSNRPENHKVFKQYSYSLWKRHRFISESHLAGFPLQ